MASDLTLTRSTDTTSGGTTTQTAAPTSTDVPGQYDTFQYSQGEYVRKNKAASQANKAGQATYQWVDDNGVAHTEKTPANTGGDSAIKSLAGTVISSIKNPDQINGGEKVSSGPGGTGALRTDANGNLLTSGGGVEYGSNGTICGLPVPPPRDVPQIPSGPVVTAPTIAAPTPITSTPADFGAGLVAPQISGGPTVGAPGQVQAGTVGAPSTVSAGSVGGGSITAPVISVQHADPVADISAGGPGRNAQLSALGQLQDIASGKTMTAADWLLQKGIDENVGAAYGLAASTQGRNPGLAMRTGAIAAKNAIAKSAADVAAQKAQEQQVATSQLAALSSNITDEDLKALTSNQTKNLQLSITDLQSRIDVLKSNAANSLSADIANQVAKLDASKANAANELAAKIADANNQMQLLQANLQAAVSTNNANEANRIQVAIANLNASTQTNIANLNAMLEVSKSNASNTLAAATTNATNATNVGISQATLAERTQADEDAQDARLKALGLEYLTAELNAKLGAAKTDAERQAASDAFWASIIGTAGKLIP